MRGRRQYDHVTVCGSILALRDVSDGRKATIVSPVLHTLREVEAESASLSWAIMLRAVTGRFRLLLADYHDAAAVRLAPLHQHATRKLHAITRGFRLPPESPHHVTLRSRGAFASPRCTTSQVKGD